MSDQSKFSSGKSSSPRGESALDGPQRLLGTRILDFELVAVLGSGGMSVVYRARHPVTLQEVAIKILPPELAVHDELKARFVEEARVLALLEHPNITALNNFVEGAGRLCLIMQFVEGMTFEKKILDEKQVATVEVLHVGVEVCKALEYAHARHVIHRDIKPSNVLLRADGAVKVTDFGIAKILGQSKLTSTGQTMGTVRYMSPEQVRGKVVDARSDLYSLGVTLYEGLAGVTPFDGENQFDIMQKHLNAKPPPLSSHGVDVASSLEKAIQTAMAKDPRDRFSDATAFRLALEAELARDPTAGVPSVGGARARRRSGAATFAMAMGVVVAVGGAAAILVLRARGRSPSPPAVKTEPPPPRPAAPPWPAPHAVPGVALAADQRFPTDGLRVQSVAPRDARALGELRDRTLAVERALAEFLASSSSAAARTARGARPAPLNLVLVPQPILNRADLWPGYGITADKTYPSRYVEGRRTLFLADSPGFERRELPYGVALHVLAPISALSTDDCFDLAQKFGEYYLARKPGSVE